MNTAKRTINNTVFNTVGWGLPIVVNLLALPYIVRQLGEEAFGVFALILSVVGYFSFLDLGLNAASVKYISKYQAQGKIDRVSQVIGSALLVYVALGTLGAGAVWVATEWLVIDVLKISQELVDVSKVAFRIGAFGFVANMVSGAFSVVPQALQRFDVSNLATVILTVLSTLSAVALLAMGGGLVQVVIARFVISMLSVLVFLLIARRLIPSLTLHVDCSWAMLKELLGFGGLSAVNRVAAQAIFHLDRLLLGWLMGPAAVTYYVIPANLTNRMHGFVSSLTCVLFPLSSGLRARADDGKLRKMYVKTAKYMAVLATVIYLPIVFLSSSILRLWMGRDFADQSGVALSVLALSSYILSFNAVPYHIVNGLGRPDVNAVSAVAGGFLNVGLCLVLIPRLGLLGAAIANLGSMIRIPFYVLFVNRRVLRVSDTLASVDTYFKPLLIAGGIFVAFLLVGLSPKTVAGLLGVLIALVSVYVLLIIVSGVLDTEDIDLFLQYIGAFVPLVGRRLAGLENSQEPDGGGSHSVTRDERAERTR
ncbi:MAG: oligosaccharide flippase family protein [bacterium]